MEDLPPESYSCQSLVDAMVVEVLGTQGMGHRMALGTARAEDMVVSKASDKNLGFGRASQVVPKTVQWIHPTHLTLAKILPWVHHTTHGIFPLPHFATPAPPVTPVAAHQVQPAHPEHCQFH